MGNGKYGQNDMNRWALGPKTFFSFRKRFEFQSERKRTLPHGNGRTSQEKLCFRMKSSINPGKIDLNLLSDICIFLSSIHIVRWMCVSCFSSSFFFFFGTQGKHKMYFSNGGRWHRDKYVQFNGHVIAIRTYQADIIIKIMFVKLLNVGTHYALRHYACICKKWECLVEIMYVSQCVQPKP